MIPGSWQIPTIICIYRLQGLGTTCYKQNGGFALGQKGQVLQPKTDAITYSKRPNEIILVITRNKALVLAL